MDFYKKLQKDYGLKICFDNCENTFGSFDGKNVSSFFTSSTSTYFGHQIQSIEGGFIFTNSEDEYRYYLINRNHGMVRSLDFYALNYSDIQNKLVDPLFDFYSFGSNYRNTDLNAYIGQLDFKRVDIYKKSRNKFYSLLKSELDESKFFLPKNRAKSVDCAFCFPIIFKNNDRDNINIAKQICDDLEIEYRPIISGFLGYQTCYKKYFESFLEYENSIKLHRDGFYIGLYHNMNYNLAKSFVKKVNMI
jgi:CDP-6-deoxy-D-xylo-4-hexulose-3-dehydrase